jgi:hypothetical protein
VESFNAAYDVLSRIFSANVLTHALQRGITGSGLVLLLMGLFMAILRPPGSWLYYLIETSRRTKEVKALADEVGGLEGKVAGLEAQLDKNLAELAIRNGQTIASTSALQLPVFSPPPLPSVAPASLVTPPASVSMPPLGGLPNGSQPSSPRPPLPI